MVVPINPPPTEKETKMNVRTKLATAAAIAAASVGGAAISNAATSGNHVVGFQHHHDAGADGPAAP